MFEEIQIRWGKKANRGIKNKSIEFIDQNYKRESPPKKNYNS